MDPGLIALTMVVAIDTDYSVSYGGNLSHRSKRKESLSSKIYLRRVRVEAPKSGLPMHSGSLCTISFNFALSHAKGYLYGCCWFKKT